MRIVFLLLLLTGCLENRLHKGDKGDSDTDTDTDSDTDTDADTDATPGDSESNPRAPKSGDLVINELMIDADAVHDKAGEWVELYNPTSDWIQVDGLRLADTNIDDWTIKPHNAKPIVIAPEGFSVLCAETDYWDNGGVDCDGSFYYFSLGKGFALSNTEDEVLLLTSTGTTIDRVNYTEGFAETGASLGVDPDYATASGNNSLSRWCAQWGSLPFGDAGSPGAKNDECF